MDLQLEKVVLVKATPQQMWKAWTTVDGLRTFFAPDARIELRIDGAYEICFDSGAPEGKKGRRGAGY